MLLRVTTTTLGSLVKPKKNNKKLKIKLINGLGRK
jgi:hypothetical protein